MTEAPLKPRCEAAVFTNRVEAIDAWLRSKGVHGGAEGLIAADPATAQLAAAQQALAEIRDTCRDTDLDNPFQVECAVKNTAEIADQALSTAGEAGGLSDANHQRT